jgi:ferredoxin/flavodoxin
MKGIICYYSGSGNTRLACDYLRKKISHADLELHDIVRKGAPDFAGYDIAGFATFTDFGAPPQYLYDFFRKVRPVSVKHAFVMNTYGFMSFKTLPLLAELASSAGFNVLAGFSLHTPENYPPMRKGGRDFDHAPDEKELRAFDGFIAELDVMIGAIGSEGAAGSVAARRVGGRWVAKLLPGFSRSKAKRDFGVQQVNGELCTECGVCMKGCPYGAITMAPKPVFDHGKCRGCWYCYNHCKEKAIYTKKFSGEFQYPKPSVDLMKKLGG